MRLNIRGFAKRVDVILMNPRYFFLITALVFGVPLLFLRPAPDVPDFGMHFMRAYSISRGHVIPKKLDNLQVSNPQVGIKKNDITYVQVGDILPGDAAFLGQAIYKSNDVSSDPHDISTADNFRLYSKVQGTGYQQVQYNTTAVYNPISYFPQAFGLLVGMIFRTPLYYSVLLASLMSFIVWLFLIQKAIQITPIGKWVMVILALLPMSLFLSGSLSPDPFLMGVMFLFFAYLANLINAKKDLSIRQMMPLIITSIVLASLKQTYFVLIFAALALWGKFKTRKEAIRAMLACILPALLVVFVWGLVVKHLDFNIITWSNPTEQAINLLKHPFSIVHPFVKTMVFGFDGVAWSYFGVLGWLTTPIPILAVVMLTGSLFIAFSVDSGKLLVTRYQKVILSLTLSSLLALIIGTLYLYWTPLKSLTIDGMQGRYFIPATIFLVPLVIGYRLKESSKKKAIYSMQALLLVSLVLTAMILTKTYYPGIV